MMVNMCKKHIKDILQELGRRIYCFIFVNNNDTYHRGGVIDTTAPIYIHKQLKKFGKHDSVLKFMHIVYPAKNICIKT